MSGNSFCTKCGAPIQPGSRFCDNCGAPVGNASGGGQKKAPKVSPRSFGEEKTVWDPNPLRSGRKDWEPPKRGFGPDMDPHPGWEPAADNGQEWGEEIAADLDSEKNNTVKWVLIGAAIGLAVLLLIFGTIHFLKAADNEKEDSKAATTEETTEAPADDPYSDDSDYDDYDDPGDDDYVAPNDPQAGQYDGADPYGYSAYRTEAQLYAPGAPVFFPESSEQYLSDYDVSGLNEDQLQKAINDIFARNGLFFETQRFQDYYDGQTWYYGYTYDKDEIQSGFNDVEKKNIDLMRKYQ